MCIVCLSRHLYVFVPILFPGPDASMAGFVRRFSKLASDFGGLGGEVVLGSPTYEACTSCPPGTSSTEATGSSDISDCSKIAANKYLM
jgi:hypothetical protein